LELTREYHFYSLATEMPLNVCARKKDGRVNPTLIAYEPPSNDRNRLKSLLGDQVYAALVEPKVADFIFIHH
jgi:hypothetical protein